MDTTKIEKKKKKDSKGKNFGRHSQCLAWWVKISADDILKYFSYLSPKEKTLADSVSA